MPRLSSLTRDRRTSVALLSATLRIVHDRHALVSASGRIWPPATSQTRRALAALGATVVLLFATFAFAFPVGQLRFRRGKGTEQCPDAAAIRAEVERRLGYDPFVPTADNTIVVTIDRETDQLMGRVQLVDADGTVRGLRSVATDVDRCEDLISTMALTISLAIDPAHVAGSAASGAASSVPPPSTSPPFTSPPSTSPPFTSPPIDAGAAQVEGPVSTPPAPQPSSATREARAARVVEDGAPGGKSTPIRWALGIGGFGSYPIHPGLAAGPLVLMTGRIANTSLALDLRGDVPSRGGGWPFQSHMLLLNIAPCLHGDPVFACAVVSPGIYVASEITDGWAPILLTGIRLGAEIPLKERLAIQVHLDTLLSAIRVRVHTQVLGSGEVWRECLHGRGYWGESSAVRGYLGQHIRAPDCPGHHQRERGRGRSRNGHVRHRPSAARSNRSERRLAAGVSGGHQQRVCAASSPRAPLVELSILDD